MMITETARLRLRYFHAADLDVMAPLFADPEVMRYGPGAQTREWVQRWLKGCLDDYYRKWGFGLWAVVEKSGNEVLGFSGLTLFDDIDGRPEIEIGYRLARAHWGKGYATEAASAVRDYAFRSLQVGRLISIIDAANVASVKVAKKVGLVHEKDACCFNPDEPLGIYAISSRVGGR